MRRNAVLVALMLAAAPGAGATAQSATGKAPTETGSITYGPYARIELGMTSPDPGEGYWLPPGYPSDPRIDFTVDMDRVHYGAVAIGLDWQNGFRGEFAITGFGDADLTAPCRGASDGSSCSTHADITRASVSTRAAMLNIYYSPREAMGEYARLQPFLVAGIGSARNEMSPWTRTNPGAGRPVRTFEGATNTGFAWSIGAGIAYEIDRRGKWPIILEASWRYYDLGTAIGGATPLPGMGSSSPVAPFQFDNTASVVAVGLRIPLQRY